MSYYNTTNLTGLGLTNANKAAKSQAKHVKLYFLVNPSVKATTEEVWEFLILNNRISKNTPLTSIRRAISDLNASNEIEKLDAMKKGCYGKQIHLYCLKNRELDQSEKANIFNNIKTKLRK